MKILVFGKTGQVAQELQRRCPTWVNATFLERNHVDLAYPDECAAAVAAHNVDVVINAAAWTAVDKAETEEAAATIINGEAPAAMARSAAIKNIPFLHISTDYVFDGFGDDPFQPDHPTAPQNAYGRSKLVGERAINTSGAHALILRTSWVVSSHGANFVKTMLRMGRERENLQVVDDQWGGPTPASSIADALYVAAQQMTDGLAGGAYHFAGMPDTNWAEFARAIMIQAGLSCRIDGIPSSEFPTPAQRPLNSRLNCSTFTQDFGIPRPDWITELNTILSELGEKT